MSLFERLGRKVEELKHEADAAKEAQVTQRCRDCGAEFFSDHETCDECGSENLVPVDDGQA